MSTAYCPVGEFSSPCPLTTAGRYPSQRAAWNGIAALSGSTVFLSPKAHEQNNAKEKSNAIPVDLFIMYTLLLVAFQMELGEPDSEAGIPLTNVERTLNIPQPKYHVGGALRGGSRMNR